MKKDIEDEVTITSQHIRAGTKSNCFYCPIALALNDKFNRPVRVTKICAHVFGKAIIKVPESVARRIDEFDKTGEMKPFKWKFKYEQRTK